MSSKRWVVIGAFGGAALACAEAEESRDGSEPPSADARAGDGGSSNGAGGKLGVAGTISSQAGTGGANAGAASGGRAGAASGGASQAGGGGGAAASAGATNGGAGAASGGAGAASGGAGAASGGVAGSTSGGGASMLGCDIDARAGATSGGARGEGGAGGLGQLFFDDFETSAGSGFTTTRGVWAVIDDGSKVYEQSLLENKLQIAIADGTCFSDQIVTAKIKIVDFNGQSSSYAAALLGRVLSVETHYLLALGSDNKLALRKRVGSTSTGATAIGTAKALSVVPGTWYDARLAIIGTSLEGCVGDVCVTAADSSIASGGVALATVNTSARFDELRVDVP